MRKRTASTLAGGGVVALGVGLLITAFTGPAAQALPSYQGSCATDVHAISSSSGWQPVNSAVWVTNGGLSRRAIVHFTADAGVSEQAEIRLAYKVDNRPLAIYGPQNLANHTEYWQSRTNLAVIPLGPGNHRIQPYWRISGATGKSGVIAARCLTAESQTL
jgi:hypothetical protein